MLWCGAGYSPRERSEIVTDSSQFPCLSVCLSVCNIVALTAECRFRGLKLKSSTVVNIKHPINSFRHSWRNTMCCLVTKCIEKNELSKFEYRALSESKTQVAHCAANYTIWERKIVLQKRRVFNLIAGGMWTTIQQTPHRPVNRSTDSRADNPGKPTKDDDRPIINIEFIVTSYY